VSASPTVRAEVEKLARLLDHDAEDLGFLEAVGPADLRALRRQMTDVLYDRDPAILQGAATAGRLLPAPLVAALAQRTFGPLLSARIAARMDADRAVDLVERLPDAFLADVAAEIDPRRTRDIIVRVPSEKVVRIACELAARGDYMAMGRFVDHLPPVAAQAVLARLSDADLLRIAFVGEEPERLRAVIADLPDERLAGTLRAADRCGLWPEALALAAELDDGRLAELAARQEDDLVDSLLTAAHDEGLWPVVLPMVRRLGDDARRRVLRRPAFRRKAVLAAIVAAATEGGLWDELEALVPLLGAPARREVAAAVARRDGAGPPPVGP
jgi:hypothetical protein